MKRGGPLRRRKGLATGKPLARGKPLQAHATGPTPGYDSVAALGWQRRTVAAGRCACCGELPTPGNPLEAHHVTTQQHIRRYVHGLQLRKGEAHSLLEELLWDWRNGMPLLRRCHDLHTRGKVRVPQACLTPAHREYAASLGLDYLLDRHYAPEVQT